MSTPSGRTDNSEAESRCPTPGCDGSGNTKSRHTSHRSVQKCPLMRDRIAEYSAVLSPEQVEDIVSGRAPFPFDAMPGQLSSNRKASSKAAASRGCIGKLTAAAAAALKKEDETRLANARSTRLADSVASSPNRAVHNTRLASRKNNRTGLATTANDDDHRDEEKEVDLVPNSPVTGRLISNKKLLLEKKGHSLSATSPVKGPSATTSTTSNHINFISSALAKKRAEMAKNAKVVLKEEPGDKQNKALSPKKKASKATNVVNSETALTNVNVLSGIGKKRKLEDTSTEQQQVPAPPKASKSAKGKSKALPKVMVEPLENSVPFSLLNCDLDAFDLVAEQNRHLKHVIQQSEKKLKALQRDELGLARRLSEAQNEVDRLRPQKALLDDPCGIGAEFLKICKKLAPLNEPPLSAEDNDQLIDLYLDRIGNIAQQRDQSEENQAAFDLLHDSFKHIWLQLLQIFSKH